MKNLRDKVKLEAARAPRTTAKQMAKKFKVPLEDIVILCRGLTRGVQTLLISGEIPFYQAYLVKELPTSEQFQFLQKHEGEPPENFSVLIMNRLGRLKIGERLRSPKVKQHAK